MAWPSGSDYQGAVQNPRTAFQDKDLQDCTVRSGAMGLPWVASGNFASVFCLEHPSGRKYAARVFNRAVTVQKARYQAVSDHLGGIVFGFMVGFEYQEQGIQIAGAWYPIIKMDWAEGVSFGKAVEDNVADPDALRFMAAQFRAVYSGLQGATMSHCDLQHGNIMVSPQGDLVLVDYDDFFVPSLKGEQALALGMPNYQHPKRGASDFNEKIDNFSAIVIYMSLGALAADSSLYAKYNNGDNLVLKEADCKALNSPAWLDLAKSPDLVVRDLVDAVRDACGKPVDQVPSLEDVIKQTGALPAGKRPVVAVPMPPTPTPSIPTPTPRPTVVVPRVQAPIAVLPVSQHHFGSVIEGAKGMPWNCEIRNHGTADLIVQSVNSSDPQFVVSYNPRPVPPADKLFVTVEFTPQGTGRIQGTLTVDTNDKPLVVTMLGDGLPKPKPQLMVSLSHDFGKVMVGREAEWQMEIRNIGQGDAQNVVVSCSSSDVRVGQWPATIPVGGSAIVVVSYQPTIVKLFRALLEVQSNAPKVDVQLLGEASDKGIRRFTPSPVKVGVKNAPATFEGAGFVRSYRYEQTLRSVTTTTGSGRGRQSITEYKPVDDPQTRQEMLPVVSTDAAGVSFGDIQFISSTLLRAEMTVALNCPPGSYDIVVTNPDGEQFVGSGMLTVEALPQGMTRCWACGKEMDEPKKDQPWTQFCPHCQKSQWRPEAGRHIE